MQDCSISIANALEILQPCTKPLVWRFIICWVLLCLFAQSCMLVSGQPAMDGRRCRLGSCTSPTRRKTSRPRTSQKKSHSIVSNMGGEIVVLCYNGKLEYSLEYTYAWARSSLMRERGYICDICFHFCISVAEKWLGLNVRWKISQICIEYIKPIRQMSDDWFIWNKPRYVISYNQVIPWHWNGKYFSLYV